MSEYKLDKTAEDINTQLNLGVAIGFPSDKTIEYGATITSGTVLEVPADGYMYWISYIAKSSAQMAIFVLDDNDRGRYGQRVGYLGLTANATIFLPVTKGSRIQLVHTNITPNKDDAIRFIYAKGSEPKE